MEPSVKVKGVAGRPCAKCGYRIPAGVSVQQNAQKKWEHVHCLQLVANNQLPKRTSDKATLQLIGGHCA